MKAPLAPSYELPSVISGLTIHAHSASVQPMASPGETGTRLALTSTGSLMAFSDGQGVLIQFGCLRDMEALIMALVFAYNEHVQHAAARGELMDAFVSVMRRRPDPQRPTVPEVGNA